jgi:hypothetical protein
MYSTAKTLLRVVYPFLTYGVHTMTTATLTSPDGTQVFSFTKVDDSHTAIRAGAHSKHVARSTAVDYYRALVTGGWVVKP